MRILLADDDSNIRYIVQMWLKKKGHFVENAQSGKEALDKLKTTAFDALITDVNMPLINGVDLVKKTLKLPQQPRLIVLLTSRCDISQLKEQLASPKIHIFNKPFSPAALTDLIEEYGSPQATAT